MAGLLTAVIWLACAPGTRAQSQADPEAGEGPLRPVTEVVTAHAMIVTANPLATQAGLEILQGGGNAIDAAAAAAFALNVVEPQSSGVGGGAFLLLALGGREDVHAWDGREEAPGSAAPKWFLRPDGSPQPFYPDRITGGRPVGIPGLAQMLDRVVRRYGKLPLMRLVEPAAHLADEGFPVSPRLARALGLHAKRLAQFPATQAVFFRPDGSPLQVGDLLRQPHLAKALRLIGNQGARAFREGPLAEAIVEAVNEAPVNPGRMTLDDLHGYEPVERGTLAFDYRGYRLYGMPPPSSGAIAIFQVLGLLADLPEGLAPGATLAESGPAGLHRFAEAMALALADRERYVADADFTPVPLAGLLDAHYLKSRAAALNWDGPLTPAAAGTPPGATAMPMQRVEDTEYVSTSHLVVVDSERNVVSLTASIEQAFGSGMVVPGWGFLLNNELTDFSAQPVDAAGREVANRVDGSRRPRITSLDFATRPGGKRPRSSMAPTLVFRGGKPVLALGSPGGPRIIPYIGLTLLRVLEGRQELQPAIARPLAVHSGSTTILEPEWSPQIRPALEKLGHKVEIGRLGSGLHGIRIASDGALHSGVDPRREGAAAGF
jgi:gamma-glutamyltranspeptidase/glutathione hydrolase